MSAGHCVLIEVDSNSLLIVGDLQGILAWQLRYHPIKLLNIVFIINSSSRSSRSSSSSSVIAVAVVAVAAV
jgi:hypothetical protein